MQLDRDSKVLSSSRTAGLSVRPSAIEIEHLGPSSIEIAHLGPSSIEIERLHLPVLGSVEIEPLRILTNLAALILKNLAALISKNLAALISTNLAALISTEIEQLVPPGLRQGYGQG